MQVGDKTIYKASAKGIFFFFCIQLYKILLSVIRTKCSALFLGPAGFGIYSLITSTLTTIELATNCGLGTSAVKDISQAETEVRQVSKVYTVLNRLVWISGIVATFICVFGAKWLSVSAFGSEDFAWAFVVSAISLLFNQLISGQGALLTGLKKYRYIVKLNVWTNTLSLVVAIICYWSWGIKAIVPVIVSTSLLNLIFSGYYAHKIKLPKISVSLQDILQQGRGMLKMGVFISLGGALTVLCGYIIRIFISHVSNIETVGLFTAVFTLVNTYLGLIFSSIERDYFPRLCSVNDDDDKFQMVISQENAVLISLLAPLVAIFVIYAPAIMYVFYSSKFVSAESMMVFTTLAMLFKVPGWTLSLVFLSKGDTKKYFVHQMIFVAYSTSLNLIGFYFGGLNGIGFSFILSYSLYSMHMYMVCKKIYNVHFNRNELKMPLLYFFILIVICIVSLTGNVVLRYAVGTVLIGIVGIVAYKDLDKKIGIKDILTKKLSQ